MKQTTINAPIEMVGIGLHKGNAVNLRLEPSDANTGIVFHRSDVGIDIALHPDNVVDTKMATVIGKGGYTVSTTEHLLSAVYAYGIDNLRICVDSQEVPIMDGSSTSFCMILDEVGTRELDEFKKLIVIKDEIGVKSGDKYAKLKPSKNPEFNFTIKFEHPIIGLQSYSFKFSKESYKKNISKARTFGFLKEVHYLRSNNLALGASLDNAIVLDDNKVVNADGLRYKDEFVRHKILDALGDLKLLGHVIIGTYEAFAGSHKLNHDLTKELLNNPDYYEVVDFDYGSVYEELAKVYA